MPLTFLQGSFRGLKELLDLAQRVSPAAMRAVVGTKADLQSERAVATADAVVGSSGPTAVGVHACMCVCVHVRLCKRESE